jgi:hypothetical protein
MQITPVKKGPLEYIIIDNVYADYELDLIKTELRYLQPHLNTNTNAPYEARSRIFLDDHYKNEHESNILLMNRRMFSALLVDKLELYNSFFSHLKYCTFHRTLINFYKDSEYSEQHRDHGIFSILTTFDLGEYNGANLLFVEHDEKIEMKNNRAIIYPSCVLHKSTPIKADANNYRVSMAQFTGYKPLENR